MSIITCCRVDGEINIPWARAQTKESAIPMAKRKNLWFIIIIHTEIVVPMPKFE